jgi:exopolysaccharide biosynthesis polyprenyl glycosylphosphotransferase
MIDGGKSDVMSALGVPAEPIDLTLIKSEDYENTEVLRDTEISDVPELLALETHARPRGSMGLRSVLIALDATALLLSWVPSIGILHGFGRRGLIAWDGPLTAMVVATILGIGLISLERLYRARTCSVRAVEMALLWKTALLVGLIDIGVDRAFRLHPAFSHVLLRAGLTFVLLTFERSAFRAWLRTARRRGRFVRPVIIVGTNEEGLSLYRLLNANPGLGFQCVGFVGHDDPGLADQGAPLLAPANRAMEAVRRTNASGVMVAATSFAPRELNRTVRDLLKGNVHLHLSAGLQGIAYQRFSATSVAYESLFYVEPIRLSRWQKVIKRGLDVVIASLALMVTAPIMLFAAVAVRLDGGSVFFRQKRVGQHGELFTLFKFRSMVVNAEELLPILRSQNERSGPLFKLTGDPRETRVGRFLRATSIDELPQLVNVLRGEMSLVGPRPAMPDEVEAFGAELLARHVVLPGITGLWQLEARDESSFESYQRYDLYYIDNWSVLLDLAIMVATIQSVIMRAVRLAFRRGPQRRPVIAAAALPTDSRQ